MKASVNKTTPQNPRMQEHAAAQADTSRKSNESLLNKELKISFRNRIKQTVSRLINLFKNIFVPCYSSNAKNDSEKKISCSFSDISSSRDEINMIDANTLQRNTFFLNKVTTYVEKQKEDITKDGMKKLVEQHAYNVSWTEDIEIDTSTKDTSQSSLIARICSVDFAFCVFLLQNQDSLKNAPTEKKLEMLKNAITTKNVLFQYALAYTGYITYQDILTPGEKEFSSELIDKIELGETSHGINYPLLFQIIANSSTEQQKDQPALKMVARDEASFEKEMRDKLSKLQTSFNKNSEKEVFALRELEKVFSRSICYDPKNIQECQELIKKKNEKKLEESLNSSEGKAKWDAVPISYHAKIIEQAIINDMDEKNFKKLLDQHIASHSLFILNEDFKDSICIAIEQDRDDLLKIIVENLYMRPFFMPGQYMYRAVLKKSSKCFEFLAYSFMLKAETQEDLDKNFKLALSYLNDVLNPKHSSFCKPLKSKLEQYRKMQALVLSKELQLRELKKEAASFDREMMDLFFGTRRRG